jgi:23S rRNA G2445 N2-methylase RlmL
MDLREIVVSLWSFSDYKQSCRATYLFRIFARISLLLLRVKTKKNKKLWRKREMVNWTAAVALGWR